MKILVTGATSFIGSHIVEELIKQGLEIHAAYRPEENFGSLHSHFLIDGLDVTSFPLDLSNRAAVNHALKDCQMVFHCDYFQSFENSHKNKLYTINQLGTRHIMEAALEHGVTKVIYTSGMETLRAPKGQNAAKESDGVALEELKSHFEKSRYLAEMEAIHCRRKGLPLIIVHPTVCLGQRDTHSSFARFLRRYLRKKIHFFLDTGLNLVDVMDVAKGHLLAAKRGMPGDRYILGNQNVYMLEILQYLEHLTSIRAPKMGLPFTMARFGNLITKRVLGMKGGISNQEIKILRTPLFYDASLARKKLGFPQSDVWEALRLGLIDLSREK